MTIGKFVKAFEESTRLDLGIRQLLRMSTYNDYSDLSGLDIDYSDPEQFLLLDELQLIMEKLPDVDAAISHLNSPIRKVSRLHRNSNGKYETEPGYYFCCGSPIEALVSDDRREIPFWTMTRVEHDGADYYLVGFKDVPMNGLTVRIRKIPC